MENEERKAERKAKRGRQQEREREKRAIIHMDTERDRQTDARAQAAYNLRNSRSPWCMSQYHEGTEAFGLSHAVHSYRSQLGCSSTTLRERTNTREREREERTQGKEKNARKELH